jgi:AcrR family transcriptional regulator
MNKNPERKMQTRSNLMDSFWTLYKTNHIGDISVKDITELSGYNRSTFYEYFTDVYDLLDQIENHIIELLKNEMAKNLMDTEDPDIINRMDQFFKKNGDYMSVLLGEKGDPAFAVKLKAAIKPVIIQSLHLSEMNYEQHLLFEFSLGGMLSALTYWFSDGMKIDSVEYCRIVKNILSNGSLKLVREMKR